MRPTRVPVQRKYAEMTDSLNVPMRCLVLGAGGFIGTNLCKFLLAQGAIVRGYGRRAPFLKDLRGVEWYAGDFSDPTGLANAVSGCDFVFHLITSTTPASANIDRVSDLRLNVVSTVKLLDICKASGVRRIIFVSSGGTIYGRDCPLPTTEDAPTDPITAYGIGKLAIEKYLALYEYLDGLEYRVLRVANPYGPYQLSTKNQGAVGMFLRRGIEGRPIEVWGDGSVVRDYVYVEDVVRALYLSALDQGGERIFNIGSGEGHSLIDLLEQVGNILGKELDVRFLPGRAVDIPASILDINKAKRDLHWIPAIGLKDGLERTAAWITSESPSVS